MTQSTQAPAYKPGTPIAPVEETEPKRGRGRPPGSRTSTTAPSRKSLETELGSTIFAINLFVMSSPLRQDALDQNEIVALAKAIDLQCKQSPRFRKYVEKFLAGGAGFGLIGVVTMIGARRASRHGMLAPEIDAYGATVFERAAKAVKNEPNEPVGA